MKEEGERDMKTWMNMEKENSKKENKKLAVETPERRTEEDQDEEK